MRRVCWCWGSLAGGRDMWRPDREWRDDLVLVVNYLSLVAWIFKSMV